MAPVDEVPESGADAERGAVIGAVSGIGR